VQAVGARDQTPFRDFGRAARGHRLRAEPIAHDDAVHLAALVNGMRKLIQHATERAAPR
jgi:hypothetical protein